MASLDAPGAMARTAKASAKKRTLNQLRRMTCGSTRGSPPL
jgi:hypothetical protein